MLPTMSLNKKQTRILVCGGFGALFGFTTGTILGSAIPTPTNWTILFGTISGLASGLYAGKHVVSSTIHPLTGSTVGIISTLTIYLTRHIRFTPLYYTNKTNLTTLSIIESFLIGGMVTALINDNYDPR